MYSLMDTWGFPCEFPHSEIFGSLAMCAYPKLIAAYHVLHRLLMPRHSPCALCSLTYCHDISFKTKLQRIFLGYVVLTYLYNYVQFSKNNVVGLNGLEPSTSRLSGVRSNQLSYRPILFWAWSLKIEQKVKKQILICTSQASCLLDFSIERRWSSRRFSYGYLVTTSPQSLTLP